MTKESDRGSAGFGTVNGIDLDEHTGLIRAVARSLYLRSFGRVSCEELLGPGWEGLRRAAARFDPSRGRFATFASICIRAAMLDYMRTQDNAISRYERVVSKLGQRPARVVVDWTTIAARTGRAPEAIAPAEPVDARELGLELFRPLMPRLRFVAIAHFLDGMPLAQVARVLACTESNVARLMKQIRELIVPRARALELLERPPPHG